MDIIQQLLTLVKINTRISSLHSSDEILKEIMTAAMELTGTSAAFILRAAADRSVDCVSRYGSDSNWSSSSALEAVDAERLVYSTQASEQSTAPSIVLGSIQTLISAPLSAEAPGTLVLQLVGQDTTSLDPQMLTLLDLFVSQVRVTASKTRLEETALRHAELAAAGELASQVAHDIRSPLAALEVISKDSVKLGQEKAGLMRAALDRIGEISRTLTEKSQPAQVQSLCPVVEALLAEKRLQFKARPGLKIEADLDAGLRAKVQAAELKRLLSNLVNNSIEALGDGPGAVMVSLRAEDGRVALSVRDAGKGIAPELLARLGRRGETHGKAGGSGLGLYHARTTAEAWGGTLEISSSPGKGTQVTVRLPAL